MGYSSGFVLECRCCEPLAFLGHERIPFGLQFLVAVIHEPMLLSGDPPMVNLTDYPEVCKPAIAPVTVLVVNFLVSGQFSAQ